VPSSPPVGARPERLAPGETDWKPTLRAAFQALVAAQATDRNATPELAARNATVALGSGLLERFGIQRRGSERSDSLSRLATALVLDVDLGDPAGAAQALAELFERSLGELGRREQGAVYTPRHVVDFMVGEALAARLADEHELPVESARGIVRGDFTEMTDSLANACGELLKGLRLLDPAVGAGAFLVGASMRIATLAQRLHDAGVPGLRQIRTPAGALGCCCHGYELDAQTATLAGVVLALATHQAGEQVAPSVVSQHDPLLDGMAGTGAGWDIILMNPPYMGEKHVRSRLGSGVSEALRAADGFSGDLLTHFVLRALGSVRPGGVVSAILSDTTFTIEATSELRRKLVEDSLLLSVAWCQPFSSVAVRGGVVTVARRAPKAKLHVECFDAPPGTSVGAALPYKTPRRLLRQLPGRPIYKPSSAAKAIIERWMEIDSLDELWYEVARRGAHQSVSRETPPAGGWTLLGCAVRGGQGLATGDDRRFVGVLAGTPEAKRAAERQRQILEAIRADERRRGDWDVLRARLGTGCQLGEALIELANADRIGELPGRKPFRIVEGADVRTSPLSPVEIENGIRNGPAWVPYETSDRSSSAGGARWVRETPIVIDWSHEAVTLLRQRRSAGPRRPVLRNEDLWYQGGVTHNRIASYLRARMMPRNAIFSSESPVYVPRAPWLTPAALLALLNAPVVEFALKTFLASRNHIEVGHIRRLPIPVLSAPQTHKLDRLGNAAVKAAQTNRGKLEGLEAQIDGFTRKLYGVGELRLELTR
jgi:hypothetical protein